MEQKTEHWTVQAVGESLAVHVAGDMDRDKKIEKMYEVLIVGNSHEPLVRTVARNTEWINNVKKFFWIAITAFVGVVITGGAAITYTLIRVYPLLQSLNRLELLK